MTLKKNEPLLSGNLIREAAKESLKKLSLRKRKPKIR